MQLVLGFLLYDSLTHPAYHKLACSLTYNYAQAFVHYLQVGEEVTLRPFVYNLVPGRLKNE